VPSSLRGAFLQAGTVMGAPDHTWLALCRVWVSAWCPPTHQASDRCLGFLTRLCSSPAHLLDLVWVRWVQDGSGDGQQGVSGLSEATPRDRSVHRGTHAPEANAPHLAAACHGGFCRLGYPFAKRPVNVE
jgi:hypothetical protein